MTSSKVRDWQYRRQHQRHHAGGQQTLGQVEEVGLPHQQLVNSRTKSQTLCTVPAKSPSGTRCALEHGPLTVAAAGGGHPRLSVPTACFELDTHPKFAPCALIISSPTRRNSGK
jgi:hypothetical protein